MTAARRVLAILVIATLATAPVGSALWYRWASVRLTDFARTLLTQAPAGWMEKTRAWFRAPRVADLVLPRDLPGDGGAVYYRFLRSWKNPGGFQMPGPHPTPPESIPLSRWQAWARDTSLDPLVRAARMKDWTGFDSAMTAHDSRPNLVALIPYSAPLVGLRVRAQARARVHDYAAARTDALTIVSLAERLQQHDPMAGAGVVPVLSTALPLLDFPPAWRDAIIDTVLARVAEFQQAPPPVMGPAFLAVPDSAFAIARDSTIPLGWRTYGLQAFYHAHLFRPWGIVFGVSHHVIDSVRSLEHNANSEMGFVARAVASYADSLNNAWPWDRWAVFQHEIPAPRDAAHAPMRQSRP